HANIFNSSGRDSHMAYRNRIQRANLLDLELGMRTELLALSVTERTESLGRQSPLTWLVASVIGGIAAGVVSSRVGRRILPRAISLSLGLFRLWPRIARWIEASRLD